MALSEIEHSLLAFNIFEVNVVKSELIQLGLKCEDLSLLSEINNVL